MAKQSRLISLEFTLDEYSGKSAKKIQRVYSVAGEQCTTLGEVWQLLKVEAQRQMDAEVQDVE